MWRAAYAVLASYAWVVAAVLVVVGFAGLWRLATAMEERTLVPAQRARCSVGDSAATILVVVPGAHSNADHLADVYHNARCPSRVYTAVARGLTAEYLALSIAAKQQGDRNRVRWLDGTSDHGERYTLMLNHIDVTLPFWDDTAITQLRNAERNATAIAKQVIVGLVPSFALPFTNVPLQPTDRLDVCLASARRARFTRSPAAPGNDAPYRLPLLPADAAVFGRTRAVLRYRRNEDGFVLYGAGAQATIRHIEVPRTTTEDIADEKYSAQIKSHGTSVIRECANYTEQAPSQHEHLDAALEAVETSGKGPGGESRSAGEAASAGQLGEDDAPGP